MTDAVERQVAADLIRRGLLVAPVLIGLGSLIWGMAGALSTAFAIGLVLANFALAAVSLSWAARISVVALAATALGGYLVRLGLLTVAVFAVHSQRWVAIVPLALTLGLTHLGLLFWETRYVSVSLAYPGLKPPSQKGA